MNIFKNKFQKYKYLFFIPLGLIATIFLINFKYNYALDYAKMDLFLVTPEGKFYGLFSLFYLISILMAIGLIFLFEFLSKVIEFYFQNKKILILLLLFLFQLTIFLHVIPVILIKTINITMYNEAYINKNTPLFTNGIFGDAEKYVTTSGLLIATEDDYFSQIAGESLTFSERNLMASFEGTYISYKNFIDNTNTNHLSNSMKVWLYKNAFESYRDLYNKKVNIDNDFKGKEIYSKILENESYFYERLTNENYEELLQECAEKNSEMFCIYNDTKDDNKDNFITESRINELYNKWLNRDTVSFHKKPIWLFEIFQYIELEN